MARRTGEVPDALCCPISMEIMRDPVIAADGHTYERAEIEAWFANNRTSPKTGAVLPHGLPPPPRGLAALHRLDLDGRRTLLRLRQLRLPLRRPRLAPQGPAPVPYKDL